MSLNPAATPFAPSTVTTTDTSPPEPSTLDTPDECQTPTDKFYSFARLHVFSPLYETNNVFLARRLDGPGPLVAVRLYQAGEGGLKALDHELEILQALREGDSKTPGFAPHIYASFTDRAARAIVYKAYDQNLASFQDRFHGRALPSHTFLQITHQLLSALEWMSTRGIVHRDLQPRHIMVNGLEDPNIRIIDYSQAVHLPHVEAPYHRGCVYYRPPDVHLGNVDYGTEYDIWSLGCILCEMITGSILFLATDGVHLIDTITSTLRFTEKRQSGLSQFLWTKENACFTARQAPGWRAILGTRHTADVATFLTSFLQFDPDARMTAEQASTWLKHLKSVGERVQSTPE